MPKRNKIEMQGLVERICKMYFNDKMSHKQITEILKQEGYDISKSGVGRTLIGQAAQMKAYKDSAKKAGWSDERVEFVKAKIMNLKVAYDEKTPEK